MSWPIDQRVYQIGLQIRVGGSCHRKGLLSTHLEALPLGDHLMLYFSQRDLYVGLNVYHHQAAGDHSCFIGCCFGTKGVATGGEDLSKILTGPTLLCWLWSIQDVRNATPFSYTEKIISYILRIPVLGVCSAHLKSSWEWGP